MPKIEVKSLPERKGSGYPAPFHEKCIDRVRKALGDAGGLTQFGVNLLTLMPGAWSSQRHWHSAEDEFVYVLSGELALVTDTGEEVLRAGDCAAFPKNDGNGHHLINKSQAPAVCLEVGARSTDDFVLYSDIDMQIDRKSGQYAHKNGMPYPHR
ncbi:MAG: cupin domain-containing protein [Alphaproteobacteria bacterium]|nr:cupin domain-containing protein [Alphaproteobacteria bacterium]MDE1986081.1 cupin domain-containing protein [Alphaproteobacteria bacterium]MDE2264411.1 cupin domain-containing protein [Alphaproteobacteria bacterium]MDE2499353.1 cupin domain-containing protein [Alphaproteobacteria bacterium]